MSKVLVGFEPGYINLTAVAANVLTTGRKTRHNRDISI